MPYLLKNASLLCLDPPSLTRADLRIDRGVIAGRAASFAPEPGDEVFDLSGKFVMPGMVCGHTHFYSALARGMPAPPRTPTSFREILELIWWRLDRALDEEQIYCSAIVAAMEAAFAGTTCVFDHHASPSHISGSLELVRKAIEQIGIRAVLCYEVTDRGGSKERDEGLNENKAFLESCRRSSSNEVDGSGLFRGLVGAHASFTLSEESLSRCADLINHFDSGLHIHVAEDACDVVDAREKYKLGVVERLEKAGALNGKTILAHGVHLDEREIGIAASANAWFAHNPRSNMNNQVGYAPVAKFGSRVLLGTDGIGADMFEEARYAFFNGRDAHGPLGADDWMRVLANNQRFASQMFGVQLNSLEAGAAADLVVLDYRSPTAVTGSNLRWHFMFGLTSSSVESVMVAGRFIIKDRKPQFDADAIYERARRASEELWARLS